MGGQPKIENVKPKKLKRSGSDSRFDNEEFLQKVEDQTMAALQQMVSSGQDEKEEVKESEKKIKRRGSFDLDTNQEYAKKQQQKTLEMTA